MKERTDWWTEKNKKGKGKQERSEMHKKDKQSGPHRTSGS